MTIQNENMEILIIAKVILKLCLVWLGLLTLVQNLDEQFFHLLTQGTPTTIAQYLGFFYLLFIVVKKGVDTWAHYRIKYYEVKKEREAHLQSQIYTGIKQSELNKSQSNEKKKQTTRRNNRRTN